MAKQLGQQYDKGEDDRLFLAGLLHDIGHLFMYLAIPGESLDTIVKAKKQERPLFQVERELLGFDYAKLGGYMMQQWHLPNSLQIMTCFQPEPGKSTQYSVETATLHIASLLAQSDLEGGSFGAGTFIVDPAAWQLTGLTEENCSKAQHTAAEQFKEVADSITALDFS
jgi:HD-like signal output (HDOD) protein